MLNVVNPNTLDNIIKTVSIAIGSILVIALLVFIKIRMDKKNKKEKISKTSK